MKKNVLKFREWELNEGIDRSYQSEIYDIFNKKITDNNIPLKKEIEESSPEESMIILDKVTDFIHQFDKDPDLEYKHVLRWMNWLNHLNLNPETFQIHVRKCRRGADDRFSSLSRTIIRLNELGKLAEKSPVGDSIVLKFREKSKDAFLQLNPNWKPREEGERGFLEK